MQRIFSFWRPTFGTGTPPSESPDQVSPGHAGAVVPDTSAAASAGGMDGSRFDAPKAAGTGLEGPIAREAVEHAGMAEDGMDKASPRPIRITYPDGGPVFEFDQLVTEEEAARALFRTAPPPGVSLTPHREGDITVDWQVRGLDAETVTSLAGNLPYLVMSNTPVVPQEEYQAERAAREWANEQALDQPISELQTTPRNLFDGLGPGAYVVNDNFVWIGSEDGARTIRWHPRLGEQFNKEIEWYLDHGLSLSESLTTFNQQWHQVNLRLSGELSGYAHVATVLYKEPEGLRKILKTAAESGVALEPGFASTPPLPRINPSDIWPFSKVPGEAGTTPHEMTQFLDQESFPEDPADTAREFDEQLGQESISQYPGLTPHQIDELLAQESLADETAPEADLDHALAEIETQASLLTSDQLVDADGEQGRVGPEELADDPYLVSVADPAAERQGAPSFNFEAHEAAGSTNVAEEAPAGSLIMVEDQASPVVPTSSAATQDEGPVSDPAFPEASATTATGDAASTAGVAKHETADQTDHANDGSLTSGLADDVAPSEAAGAEVSYPEDGLADDVDGDELCDANDDPKAVDLSDAGGDAAYPVSAAYPVDADYPVSEGSQADVGGADGGGDGPDW